MTQLFVTIWLKSEDSDEDKERISNIIRSIAKEMKISIDDDLMVSSGGGRITVRGMFESERQEEILKSFEESIAEKTERKAKGRLLKQ
ncbi:MAG: hypothetical protein ACW99G_22420 [Candidatus Thorarchaeota archaeon]|jgi:hypothetical protein